MAADRRGAVTAGAVVDNAGPDRPLTVGELLGTIISRWWILALALLVGFAGGYYLADQRPAVYAASTQLLLRPTPAEAAADGVNLDTEAQLVTSDRTAALAAEELGDVPADELAGRVEVSVPPNTLVLSISFQAPTPDQARRGAVAVADAYLELREQDARTRLDERISALTDRIDRLRDESAVEPVPSDVISALETERALLEAEPVRVGEVISPPDLPAAPDAPDPLLYTVGGTAAGLLLGLAAILLVEHLDPRVRRVRDLPGRLAGQVLLDLPGRPATTTVPPADPLSRQFSRLRNVLRARARYASPGGGTPEVWLLCGASAGRSTGLVTAHLAAALARSGARVAVVAADPASTVSPALAVPPAPAGRGLPDVVGGVTPAADALVPAPAVAGVSVLPPGPVAVAELPVPDLAEAVSRLGSVVTHVLIETPPTSQTMDAQALGPLASAVVLVVEKRRSRGAEVRAAVRDLDQVGVPLTGVVLLAGPRRSLWSRLPGRSDRGTPAAPPSPDNRVTRPAPDPVGDPAGR